MDGAPDIFISYSSQERAWVEEKVLRRLRACRLSDGRAPRVFFDRDRREGLQAGQHWREALAAAIAHCRWFIPIYTLSYLASDECLWELNLAFDQDPMGRNRGLVPVLKDPTAGSRIPLHLMQVQYVAVDVQDWFERLCQALGLEPVQEVPVLRFNSALPASVVVHNTLPTVEVELVTASGTPDGEHEIALSATGGELRGTLRGMTEYGVARFTDLSFGKAAPSVRLLASADGCQPAQGGALLVQAPAVVESARPRPNRRIDAGGDAVFFDDDRAVAVIGRGSVSVWTIDGVALACAQLTAPIRHSMRVDGALALADWNGRVLLLKRNGDVGEWDLSSKEEELAVPGGIAAIGSTLFAGYWNGRVYSLDFGQEAQLAWYHEGGVQALAADGKRLALVDLSGRLVCREGEVTTAPVPLDEPCVHLLKAFQGSLVVVGEQHLVQHRVNSARLLRETMRIGEVQAVLGDTNLPVVCDVFGRGGRFNAGLTFLRRFQVPARSVPVSADRHGEWAVFRRPDDAHFLLNESRVVYTHNGSLAVSENGRYFAVGGDAGLQVVTSAEMTERFH